MARLQLLYCEQCGQKVYSLWWHFRLSGTWWGDHSPCTLCHKTKTWLMKENTSYVWAHHAFIKEYWPKAQKEYFKIHTFLTHTTGYTTTLDCIEILSNNFLKKHFRQDAQADEERSQEVIIQDQSECTGLVWIIQDLDFQTKSRMCNPYHTIPHNDDLQPLNPSTFTRGGNLQVCYVFAW